MLTAQTCLSSFEIKKMTLMCFFFYSFSLAGV